MRIVGATCCEEEYIPQKCDSVIGIGTRKHFLV
jgi:hypothetical protein